MASLTPSPLLSSCFVGSNNEVHYDNLHIGLPYVRNFPDMSRISLLKFVSGNNFKGYSSVRNFDRFRGSYHQVLWKMCIIRSGREKHAFSYCIALSRLCSNSVTFSSVIVVLFCGGLGVVRTYWKHKRNQGGPGSHAPQNFRISSYFVHWEAVSQTKYCW